MKLFCCNVGMILAFDSTSSILGLFGKVNLTGTFFSCYSDYSVARWRRDTELPDYSTKKGDSFTSEGILISSFFSSDSWVYCLSAKVSYLVVE